MPVSSTAPDPAEGDPSALIGRVLDGRYEVTGLLGAGGVGRVYRARHINLHRDVAIKVLLEQYQLVPELQRRFEREATALSALSHPNVVTITDFVGSRELTFLVMELVEGEDLHRFLARRPPTPTQAWSVMEQLLSSLAYAHERDVVHRDLKPQNVKIRRLAGGRLHATILDFGLAKFLDGSGPGANLTETGLVVGTPAYMAPEQASGAKADRRSDVYAAALLFYEMLAGRHPFDLVDGAELLRAHLLKTPPKLAERTPGCTASAELEAFFDKSFAKDPAMRFEDGAAMLEALLKLDPESSFTPAPHPRRPSPITAAATTRLASEAAARPWARPALWWGLGLGASAAVALGLLALTYVSAEPAVAIPTPTESSPTTVEVNAISAAEDPPVVEAPPPEKIVAPAVTPVESDAVVRARRSVRPRNPWRDDDMLPLFAATRVRLERGDPIDDDVVRRLRALQRRHPDVRARLLLAAIAKLTGEDAEALDGYRRAWEIDPSVRGDPRMQRDLIGLVASAGTHEAASDLVVAAYGAEVKAWLRRQIQRYRDPVRRERLSALYERL